MKTFIEVQEKLKDEIKQWFPVQCREPYTDFYLYLFPQKPGSESDLGIYREKRDCKYIIVGKLDKGKTVEQNFTKFSNLLRGMPCLDVEE